MSVFDPDQYDMPALSYEQPQGGRMTMEQMQAELNRMRAEAEAQQQRPMQYPPAATQYTPTAAYVPNQRKMQAIDRRLKKGEYYRALMEGSLFDQTDELAVEVEREIKDFIVTRMEALVGEDPQAQEAARFSDEEVQLLKMWAGALKQKAATASAPTPTATPTVRPVTVPSPSPVVTPAPAPQPVEPVAPAAPAAPAVRRKRAPTVRMPATVESAAAAPAPVVPPQVTQPAPVADGRPPKPGKARNTGPGPKPIPVPQGAYMESVMQQRAMMEASDVNRVVDTGTTEVKVSR